MTKADKILACIDGSSHATAVCDAAAWASRQLGAPLTFVHVIDRTIRPAAADISGQIGLGTREHLLEELARLDEQRGKLDQEQGRLMLEAARERARSAGVNDPETRQRNGELVETLVELEDAIRLLVLGKQGETAASAQGHLGSNLERVIRSLHCPILITTANFSPPERVLIAFDGSSTAHAMIDRVAASPLAAGIECHLVAVGETNETLRRQLEDARDLLARVCASVRIEILAGEVEAALRAYKQSHAIDMLVMGAYGHSRIRHLLVGSTTTQMIRRASVPLLIMR